MQKVVTIDCDYLEPAFAAAYLVVEGDKALFVDNNTAHATDRLMSALSAADLRPDQVEYLIVTHAHLDHAGGTSALLARCPRATVLAHPKAARTLIDPTKLVASARKVYGEAEFARLYGDLGPLPAARVRAVEDEERFRFGGSTLRFFHTKGHATHHFCIHHSTSNGVFSGDAFGLRYPALQSKGLFIFPSTSPIDFEPVEARRSVRRIVETGAERVFPTHFGEVREVKEAAEQLIAHLDAHEQVLQEAKAALARGTSGPALTALCETRLREHFERYFASHGGVPGPDTWRLIKLDLELNAAGIAFVAERPPKPV
jgi:glyoxylase-like metal-dependent hydrolase (beta-lactamase superfamily II)